MKFLVEVVVEEGKDQKTNQRQLKLIGIVSLSI
jgi:hypothetical protein